MFCEKCGKQIGDDEDFRACKRDRGNKIFYDGWFR